MLADLSIKARLLFLSGVLIAMVAAATSALLTNLPKIPAR